MCYKCDELHVVYASDDKFCEILGVSLISLYYNNRNFKDISVYILDNNISSENKSKIESISCEYHRKKPVWVSAIDISEVLNVDVVADRGSLAQYARLFIASILDENLERVLYLDCDIIIKESIEELWNIDLEGNTIAALKDAFSKYYRKNINLEENDVMFNSGVMLIDLNKWRKNDIEKKLLEFISEHNGVIQQGDQGALNAVLSKETFCFSPKFNSVTIFYDFSYEEINIYRKPVDFYSQKEINEAVCNPVIIHYTTSYISVRPWYEGCCHKYCNLWMKYKEISPWRDSELWKSKGKCDIKSIYSNIVNKLPRRLNIRLSSIIQIYGRPLLYSIKKYR